jgi:hypothetical protein
MTAGIFISYRRDDARHAAGRLADDLAEVFGTEGIFRDIEAIEPGLDFARVLERALAHCVVMLVLIGPGWLHARDAQGRRRLEADKDWIRQEVVRALERDVRVVPVLLEGTPRPQADELPPDMRRLVSRQTFELSDARWRSDVQRLVDALAKVPGLQRQRPAAAGAPAAAVPPPVPQPARGGRGRTLLLGAVVGIAGLLVLAAALDDGDTEVEASAPAPLAAPSPQMQPPPPQRVQSQPQQTQPQRPAPPQWPDVSGLWRTASGEVYRFEQDGRSVRLVAELGGQRVGEGQGQFDGQLLRLAVAMSVNGVPMGNINCDMQPAPDQRSYTGLCVGPTGSFPAQFFR